jgi:hypothetical protein
MILKHEWIRTRTPLLLVLAIAALVALMTFLLGMIAAPVVGLVFAMVILMMTPIAVQIYLMFDFYRSSFGANGAMLTHTLPVSGRRLFWMKLLYAFVVSAVVMLIVTVLNVLICVLIARAADMNFGEGVHYLQELASGHPVTVSVIIFSLLYGSIGTIANYFACVVLGSTGWARRLGPGGPVVMFIILSVVGQLLALVTMFLPPYLNMETDKMLFSMGFIDFINDSSDSLMPVIPFFAGAVLSVVLVFWSARNMNKKVDLAV